MPTPFKSSKLKRRPNYLYLALTAAFLPLAGTPSFADSLLVGSGGDGGVATGGTAAGDGGGGGIGGGGGAGGGGLSGGAGGGLVQGGDGFAGFNEPGASNDGVDGGAGGASGALGGQAGVGGGGGAAGTAGIPGGGGGGGLGAGGGQGNGGAGGDGGIIVGVDGASFGGTASQGAQVASVGNLAASTAYDYVGIGGGGGGAGVTTSGGDGSAGNLTVSNATLTVNRSLLLGGAGGGGGLGGSGGRGGNGVLTLTNATLSVADTLLIGGADGGSTGFDIYAGGQGGDGTLTIGGNSTLSIGGGARVVLGGGTGGGAGIFNLGQGTANFAGGGAFIINANGTLNIGDSAPGGAAGGTITNLSTLVNNGRINFNQAGVGTYLLTSSVSGSGSVGVNAPGTTVFLGNYTYTGGTTVSAGTLRIGAGGVTGSISGDIVNNSSVVFNRSGSVDYAGAMSGSGTLEKAGTGTLLLLGASTATGNNYVSRGALELTGAAARLGSATSDLTIGDAGDAAMTVSNAAQLVSHDVQVGSVFGGTAIVTGADSKWTANYVHVGVGTTGELRLLDGGQLSSLRGFVGTFANGSALVSGTNTLWTSTTGLILGNLPGTTGSLVLEKGGTAIASQVEMGGTGGMLHVYGSDASGRGVLQASSIIRHAGTTTGTVYIDGGVLRAAASEANFLQGFAAGDITVGSGGMYLDSNGYDVGISTALGGAGRLNKTGAGKLTLSGANTYAGGTAVQAGTLAAGASQVLGAGAVDVSAGAALELNGFGQSVTALSGAGEVRLGSAALAVGAGNSTTVFSGAVSGTGGLLKQGSGALTLSGVSTYTGTTQIYAGSLVVDGSIANSSVIVGNGARLGGSGTVGATTVASGGIVAPGNLLGSLRVAGDFNLATGAMLDYALGAPGTGPSAPGASSHLQVDGNVTLNGALTLSDPAGTAGLGYYRLISYSGLLSGGGLQLGAIPASLAANDVRVVSEVAGHLDLRIGTTGSNLLQTWTGGNGTWSSAATNWMNDGGNIPEAWANNHAVFLTTGGGTVGVQGTQSFAGLQFVADGYRLNGVGTLETQAGGSELRVLGGAVATIDTVISGAGGVDKTQGGTLVLTGANTYTGGTTVQAGTLVAGASQVLGSGSVDVSAGATLDLNGYGQSVAALTGAGDVRLGSATLALGAGNGNTAFSGVVSGTGGLRKQGSGALTLSGVNTYTGATQIDAGSLVVNGSIANSAVTVGSGARLGGSGTVGATVVASGGVVAPGNSLGSLRVAGDFTLAAGATLDYELGAPGTGASAPGASDHLQVDGNVTLNGTLTLSDPASTAGLGYYRLISYGGQLSGDGLQVGAIPAALASHNVRVVSEVAGYLDLRVGATGSNLLQTWTGGNGSWNSSASDWINDGGAMPEVWAGNHAVFLTTGGGTVGVQGTQSFAGLQFVADGYRLNGAGTLETRAGGSELRVLGGAVATIDTVISGAGGIDKTQGGTLVLNGANTYAGGTTVSGGVLSVSGDTNLGASGAMVALNGGTLRIANAAYEGTGRSLALGAAGGTLDLPNDFTLQGAVSGKGAFTKTGAGLLTLASDSSAYAGTATVSSGGLTLTEGARLGGSLQVAPGALLAGGGTLGSATIMAGAVHAPGGDGIGTQTFAGDYVNHGTLRVDATPTTHRSIVVTGGVDITGAILDLRLSPADASAWSPMTGPYTLISKQGAGAVAGGFAAVNNPLLFLDASVNTAGGDGNDVTLTLERNGRSVASAAGTPNQRAVATAIDSLPQSHEVWRNAMLSTDAGQVQQGLNQFSGDTHVSLVSALMNATPFTTQTGLARLRNNLSAPMLPGAPSAQAGGVSDAPATAALLPRSGASPLWTQVTGDWQRQQGDGNAPGADQSSTGVVVGGDVGVGQGWRVGGALGYTDARLRPDQRTATAKTQSYTATVYGGKSYAAGLGAVNILAGAAYSWHDIDTRRQVRYGSLEQTLTANYSGSTTQLFAEAGYSMVVSPTVTLEPFVGLSWSELRVRAFSESGGSAALSGSAMTQDTTSTLAGLRGQWAPTQSAIELRGMLGWRHAYGSLRPSQTLAFDQGASFSVAGAPIARDAARVEVGADIVVVHNLTAGLNYGGEFGGGNRQHTGSLDVRWRF